MYFNAISIDLYAIRHMCLGQICPEVDPGRCYVYGLCITDALEYGVPRCANG